MNIVVISGNLGAAPEVRQTATGLTVANLSVATNERAKQDGEWVDHTEWHRVTVFGKQGELCQQFLSKGSKVVVNGRLRTRKFTDKQGQERWSTEIVADSVEFASRANSNQPPAPSSSAPSPAPVNSQPTNTWQDDEIPF
jgi:single-strand DNA-binding protein